MQKIMSFIKRLLSAQSVRYLISSCVAFAVSYCVALALDAALGGVTAFSVEAATAAAFIISSQVNFWMNRSWVFKSKKPPLPELGGYYSLALVSFAVKTYVFIEIMVRLLRLSLAIAMPISEAAMFVINYVVQKKLIFKKKDSEKPQK